MKREKEAALTPLMIYKERESGRQLMTSLISETLIGVTRDLRYQRSKSLKLIMIFHKISKYTLINQGVL